MRGRRGHKFNVSYIIARWQLFLDHIAVKQPNSSRISFGKTTIKMRARPTVENKKNESLLVRALKLTCPTAKYRLYRVQSGNHPSAQLLCKQKRQRMPLQSGRHVCVCRFERLARRNFGHFSLLLPEKSSYWKHTTQIRRLLGRSTASANVSAPPAAYRWAVVARLMHLMHSPLSLSYAIIHLHFFCAYIIH